mmetsp:Transcript_21464/g.38456  ORF Transcript_21464/g.38456 Transcript_21464/m.38456 type:complete len:207 (-) Transcript_21464:32-652(-)
MEARIELLIAIVDRKSGAKTSPIEIKYDVAFWGVVILANVRTLLIDTYDIPLLDTISKSDDQPRTSISNVTIVKIPFRSPTRLKPIRCNEPYPKRCFFRHFGDFDFIVGSCRIVVEAYVEGCALSCRRKCDGGVGGGIGRLSFSFCYVKLSSFRTVADPFQVVCTLRHYRTAVASFYLLVCVRLILCSFGVSILWGLKALPVCHLL